MRKTSVPAAVIEHAVHLACRAPSFHNSQPWTWVVADDEIRLFVDAERIAATDRGGRQALISCGAALDHLRVACAAAGWEALVDYYPNPNNQGHLATIDCVPLPHVTDAHRRRADAIRRRRSDRLPFAAPRGWADFEPVMRRAVHTDVSAVDVVPPADRLDVARASALAETLRDYDSAYHAELDSWTSPFSVGEGIPHSALPSAQESARVDVGRHFPVTHGLPRRPDVAEDRSTIVVISALDDVRRDVLGCGETLSAVLLEATLAGLASCTLSHLTEARATSDVITAITGRPFPEVLVRLGSVPADDEVPPPTPRRPLSDVLHFR